MNLNIPENIIYGRKILLVGIGGGFDVFGGIPLANTLGLNRFVFANYNRNCKEMLLNHSDLREGKLHEFLKKEEAWADVDVYALPRVGVKHMVQCLETIVKEREIDGILAVDGGVDSLMHGDEEGAGTILEDSIVLAALNQLPIKEKTLACVGFGTEVEEGVCHKLVLDNINELIRENAFYGSCSLTKKMECFDFYKKACEYVWGDGNQSHVQTRVIESVLGEHLYDNIEANVANAVEASFNPSFLTSTYLFFDLATVAGKNKLIPYLNNTWTHTDAFMMLRQCVDKFSRRGRQPM